MKKFKTHNNDNNIIACGGLVGQIRKVPYNLLVDIFGEPHESDGYKVDAEWNIKFNDGRVASIYNYKTGKNYLGDEGIPTKEITTWNIGGLKKSIVKDIVDIINNKLEKEKNDDED